MAILLSLVTLRLASTLACQGKQALFPALPQLLSLSFWGQAPPDTSAGCSPRGGPAGRLLQLCASLRPSRCYPDLAKFQKNVNKSTSAGFFFAGIDAAT